MAFTVSVPPDVTESLPAALTARRVGARYAAQSYRPDVTIAGLPFKMAPGPQRAYVRSTSDWSVQQIDTSKSAGEQTLSSWWTRSWESWHRGAGATYYEPGSVESTQWRFRDSSGVNPWTPGQLTLHRRMVNVVSSPGAYCTGVSGARVAGQDVAFAVVDGVLHRWTTVGDVTYAGPVLTGRPMVAGSRVACASVDGVAVGDTTGGAMAGLWSRPGGADAWVAKSRLIVAAGGTLWEKDWTGGALVEADQLWTHPDPGWRWLSVAEAPGAILAAGACGGTSGVYAISLTDPGDGGAPILGVPVQVAVLPEGEELLCMAVYLGSYVAIGTSAGLRVGAVDPSGQVQYGPLLFEGHPVSGLAGRDRFLVAAVDSQTSDGLNPGVATVDLGEQITDYRFAWAWGERVGDGSLPVGAAYVGDRLVVAATGTGLWVEDESLLVESGWVAGGLTRFATSELKRFARMRCQALAPAGTGVSLATALPGGTPVFQMRLAGGANDSGDIVLGSPTAPTAALEIVVTLEADSGGTVGPTVSGLTLKALPVPPALRDIEYPLACFDIEQDSAGQETGWQGAAWERLSVLEALESVDPLVQVTDHRTGEEYTGRLKAIKFAAQSVPQPGGGNFGGMMFVSIVKLS